jgi:hypothetical protein
VWGQTLRIPDRRAWGRCVEIDLAQTVARLHTSEDLIRRSFHPADKNLLPPQVRSGESLPDWLKSRSDDEARPILACNALHTNFVRGNGFVIIDKQLICKPAGAIPLDGNQHQPLDGPYTVLQLAPDPARVRRLEIRQGALLDKPRCNLAISGPSIVHRGQNSTNGIPVRLPESGQTIRDEINFLPDDDSGRTSWTALGVNASGHLLAVSIFTGAPQRVSEGGKQVVFQPSPGDGLSLHEMADLVLHLGASEAILAGGSGDTQQFVTGKTAWCAMPRAQAGRVQVSSSLRGLGAILAIYPALTQNDLTGKV